jgi:uncharacterized membrane protein YdfJ with MMPL/SSD domain
VSDLLNRLGTFAARHPWRVLGAWLTMMGVGMAVAMPGGSRRAAEPAVGPGGQAAEIPEQRVAEAPELLPR